MRPLSPFHQELRARCSRDQRSPATVQNPRDRAGDGGAGGARSHSINRLAGAKQRIARRHQRRRKYPLEPFGWCPPHLPCCRQFRRRPYPRPKCRPKHRPEPPALPSAEPDDAPARDPLLSLDEVSPAVPPADPTPAKRVPPVLSQPLKAIIIAVPGKQRNYLPS